MEAAERIRAGDVVVFKWDTAPDGQLTGILVSGDDKSWVDIRTKNQLFKVPREDILQLVSRPQESVPVRETLTIGRLKRLLEGFEDSTEIEVEGCDCVGDAKGIELTDGKLLITRI